MDLKSSKPQSSTKIDLCAFHSNQILALLLEIRCIMSEIGIFLPRKDSKRVKKLKKNVPSYWFFPTNYLSPKLKWLEGDEGGYYEGEIRQILISSPLSAASHNQICPGRHILALPGIVFVWIVKCICLNCQMYFSELSNVFVWIVKFICLDIRKYLSKFQN